jgi:hypothetical protein
VPAVAVWGTQTWMKFDLRKTSPRGKISGDRYGRGCRSDGPMVRRILAPSGRYSSGHIRLSLSDAQNKKGRQGGGPRCLSWDIGREYIVARPRRLSPAQSISLDPGHAAT